MAEVFDFHNDVFVLAVIRRRVLLLARAPVFNESEVDDLVQEIHLRLMRSIQSYDPAIGHPYRLGHYGNPNGSGFSLFLAKVSDPRRLDWCIDAFLAEFQRPFVLFLTSKRMLSSRNETMLDSRGSLVVPLDQSLLLSDDGEWCLSPWARQQLVAFRDRLMPPANTVTGRFPTPSGSRWSDVEMRFSDTEKISVVIRDQRQVLTYSQLGLVDSRSGKPSKQWELLLKFAREHGMMTWLSPDACRKNRNRHWRFAVTDTLREQKVDERVLHLCDLTLLTTTGVYDRDCKVCCVQILGDANRAKHLRSIAAFGHPDQPLQPRAQTPCCLHAGMPTAMELRCVDHSTAVIRSVSAHA
jgi:hypothetical protein